MDEDFPPLGTPLKDKRPVDSFGFLLRSHLPNDTQGTTRAGTPTLPPRSPFAARSSGIVVVPESFESVEPVSIDIYATAWPQHHTF